MILEINMILTIYLFKKALKIQMKKLKKTSRKFKNT